MSAKCCAQQSIIGKILVWLNLLRDRGSIASQRRPCWQSWSRFPSVFSRNPLVSEAFSGVLCIEKSSLFCMQWSHVHWFSAFFGILFRCFARYVWNHSTIKPQIQQKSPTQTPRSSVERQATWAIVPPLPRICNPKSFFDPTCDPQHEKIPHRFEDKRHDVQRENLDAFFEKTSFYDFMTRTFSIIYRPFGMRWWKPPSEASASRRMNTCSKRNWFSVQCRSFEYNLDNFRLFCAFHLKNILSNSYLTWSFSIHVATPC